MASVQIWSSQIFVSVKASAVFIHYPKWPQVYSEVYNEVYKSGAPSGERF